MTPVWVAAGAVYIPGCAVPTRKGPRRVCAADEDAVTLAVEAGVRALDSWSSGSTPVGELVVALHHTAAGSDRGTDAHVVREALGLANTVRVVSMSSADTLSGLAAIQGIRDAATLVIAAEAGHGHTAAAAAALIVVPTSGSADDVVGLVELARASGLTHEHWTGSETPGREPDFRFLEHRYRTLAAQLVGPDLGAQLGDVSRLYVSAPLPSDFRGLWAALRGSESAAPARISVVDRGIAGPMAAIVDAAVNRPPNGCGALFASGSGQSVVLTLTVPADARRRFVWCEPSATRPPSPLVAEGPQLSFPLESPFYVRNWSSMLRLEAASCTACGHLALPASQRPICPKCHGRTWVTHALPRDGHVYASLENKFLPVGFPKSLAFVLGELANGFKYWAPTPAEIARHEVQIGAPVTLALRSFTERDGITAYGMKYLPDTADAGHGSELAPSAPNS